MFGQLSGYDEPGREFFFPEPLGLEVKKKKKKGKKLLAMRARGLELPTFGSTEQCSTRAVLYQWRHKQGVAINGVLTE